MPRMLWREIVIVLTCTLALTGQRDEVSAEPEREMIAPFANDEKKSKWLEPTDLPQPLLTILDGVLHPDRRRWIISREPEAAVGEETVFNVRDAIGNFVIYVRSGDTWQRVNGKAGLPHVRRFLGNRKLLKQDLETPSSLDCFLRLFVDLHWKHGGQIVGPLFLQEYGKDLGAWMGEEKDPKVLESFCTAPVVRTDGNVMTIKFNFMTVEGSMIEWNLRGTYDGVTFLLDDAKAVTIRKDGTFFFPIMGG